MPNIDGFDYETYERSGGLARRNFRHANGGPEELPAKTLGKRKKRAVPRGCPENDGGAHVYAVCLITIAGIRGPYTYRSTRCIGCGKRKRRQGWLSRDGEYYSVIEGN